MKSIVKDSTENLEILKQIPGMEDHVQVVLSKPTAFEKADTQLVEMEPVTESYQQKVRRLKSLIDAAAVMYRSKSYPNEVRSRFLAKINRYQKELDKLQK